MVNLHIYDVKDCDAKMALSCGMSFAKEFPDRVGLHQGCGYFQWDQTQFYAYRTKTGRIVVRGTYLVEAGK
jgi:hypothetical protein